MRLDIIMNERCRSIYDLGLGLGGYGGCFGKDVLTGRGSHR